MLFVLSPAKTLDFTPAEQAVEGTRPQFAHETKSLVRIARKLKSADLRRLMDISEALAELNVARFKAFAFEGTPSDVPAAFAFAGDVYEGLDARTLPSEDLAWSQDRLRILSGLYGILRPLDLIQPYRLEMGVRLSTDRGATLYDFWGDRVATALNKAAHGHADPTLVNLASQEYFGAVDAKALKLPVLTCAFREEKGGELRMVSFYAKIARGLMARFAVENRIERREDLKAFNTAGYRFSPQLSSEREWVFTRPQPEPKGAQTAAREDARV